MLLKINLNIGLWKVQDGLRSGHLLDGNGWIGVVGHRNGSDYHLACRQVKLFIIDSLPAGIHYTFSIEILVGREEHFAG